ncbi:MAG: DUF308 domain-containing protein [Bacteroidota bacterium]|nr:DUF308 domain-containing protein [Bacteroidota bacterium]
METIRYKNWWFLALNGLIAILLGILLMSFSQEVIEKIVWIFGLGVLIIGIILVIAAIYRLKKEKGIALLMLQSVASIVIGLCIIIFTKDSLRIFMILAGVWAVMIGISQLVILVNVRKDLSHKNVILFNGLFTIVLGVIFIFNPYAVFSAVIWVVRILGGLAALFGLIMIYQSFIIRNVKLPEEEKPSEAVKSQEA